MAKTLIYHNPRCTKSRQGVKFLEENGEDFETVLYLDSPLSSGELSAVVTALGIQPQELLRKNEAVYKEKFKGRNLSPEEWIEAMIEFPKLMERPIVVKNGKAVIGRPTEKILEIL